LPVGVRSKALQSRWALTTIAPPIAPAASKGAAA
jgi:hypothetical protein